MTRPQSRWWRAYDAALENPKVQRLSDKLFRTWFNVLCVACRSGGVLPAVTDMAFLLRLSDAETERRLHDLENAGLLDRIDGRLKPHDWDEMQFQSDVSTGRVKRFRERTRNVSPSLHETAPETETETYTESETETDINPSLRSGSSTQPVDLLSPIDENQSIKPKRQRADDTELILDVCDKWNCLAASVGLSQVDNISDGRLTKLRQRLKDLRDAYGYDDPRTGFDAVVTKIRGSPFLQGQNDRRWKANFDWITKAENFTKLMEGNYEGSTNGYQGRH